MNIGKVCPFPSDNTNLFSTLWYTSTSTIELVAMFKSHLSRQALTWKSILFIILLVGSGFCVDMKPPSDVSKPALTPGSAPSANTHHHNHHHHKHQMPSSSQSALIRREDYSCDKERPCANGACCGPSGFCGYGPASCGTGCVSNCNAHAECGEFSSRANKKCPLNTCCSKYGFCGTVKVGQDCSSKFVLIEGLTSAVSFVGLLYRRLPVKLCS
jgi:hypothetical protein